MAPNLIDNSGKKKSSLAELRLPLIFLHPVKNSRNKKKFISCLNFQNRFQVESDVTFQSVHMQQIG
jgi:hypothetical protein